MQSSDTATSDESSLAQGSTAHPSQSQLIQRTNKAAALKTNHPEKLSSTPFFLFRFYFLNLFYFYIIMVNM